jgi:Mg2+-importing ATPase
VFAIRTRRHLFHSWPHPALGYLAIGIVLLGVVLPYTPLAPWFGFVPPPVSFFAYLIIAVVAYLGLVDLIKHGFYRHLARRRTRWRRPRHRL